MKKQVLAGTLLAFLSVGFDSRPGEGREVEILLRDGSKITAEILSVRDSSIVVAHPTGLTEEELQRMDKVIAVLPYRNVLQVETPGSSYTLVGLGIGAAVGCATGCALGSSKSVNQDKNDTFGCNAAEEQANNTFAGAAIGTGVGALAGALIGGASSESAKQLVTPTQRDFRALTGVARYGAQEPGYLKAIAP